MGERHVISGHHIASGIGRLLDTDLNTLLSFQEDLSDREIALFLNELSELSEKEGVEKAFAAAKDKIKQFPNCYSYY